MTQFYWIPWFLSTPRDLTDFNDRLNWAEELPNGDSESPASSVPGPSDIAIFGSPVGIFYGSGQPSGQINGDATTSELEFEQGSNPPPLGWFLNGNQTTGTLDVVNSVVNVSAGAVVKTGQLTLEESTAGIVVGGTLDADAVTSTANNNITIASTGQVEISTVTAPITITFQGVGGQLIFNTEQGVLNAEQGVPNVTVNNFAAGDTIDLTGVVADEDYYNKNTSVLTLYQAKYGQSLSAVGSLNIGEVDTDGSFFLTPDGSGGTLVTAGAPPPTELQLAEISDEAYMPIPVVDGYSELGNPYVDNGFQAVAYADDAPGTSTPDQIVVAFRGTDLSNLLTAVKNILTDTSFATDYANYDLSSYVEDASEYLEGIRDKYPTANFTLTGHSLGGAIAALVGNASSYPTATFNAPGSSQLIQSLSSSLGLAADVNSELPTDQILPSNSQLPWYDTAYRLEGDQVSLIGQQIGQVWTISNPGILNWLNFFEAHLISTVISDINNPTDSGVPDLPYPGLITASLTNSVGNLITSNFDSINVVQQILEPFDPSGGVNFQMTESSSSPLFASLALPYLPGAQSYEVSFETGTTWSPVQNVAPGQTVAPTSPFNAFDFVPVDGNGQPVPIAGLVMDLTFASSGVFNGELTATEAACFLGGTFVATSHGEVAVRNLRIGDLAVTASGTLRPIVWIGYRKLDISRHPEPESVWPIRVAPNAFGDGLPHRDLWLSPGHNVAFEGVIMPVSALINGVSVAQIKRDHVEYWHVELDAHDIILAEGLPAESYLDCGNRTAFENGGAFIEAHPDFKPRHWAETCLPLVSEGPEVTRAKAMLLDRLKAAGHEINSDPDPHIIADGQRIEPTVRGALRYAFAVPRGRSDIRLVSRTFVPAHAFADRTDARSLGICVKRLQIDGEVIALDDATLVPADWHDKEPDLRWTRGSAKLPPKTRFVVIHLAGTGHYWRAPKDEAVALYA